MVTLFVSTALVGVMGGIRSLTLAGVKARRIDLLQRLAAQKMNELGPVTSLSSADTQGDFSEEGYSDVTWQVQVGISGVDYVDTVRVTTTEGGESQSLAALFYVPPTSGSSTQ